MKGKRRNKAEENRKRREMRKRGYCVLLAILLMIGTCLIPKMQVKAASIYDLEEELGTDESVTCYPTWSNEYYYKVTLKEKGMLTLNIESKRQYVYIRLYNEDGERMTKSANISSSKGRIEDFSDISWQRY